ncbi:MAG: GH116 family glycosyl hydrolase [Candidatus Hydrogenedentales bacterium]
MSEVDRGDAEGQFQTAGVPLGGIGAGSMELGRDGRFRNITINNNRTAADRIDVSGGAFLALRAACRGKVQTRILQPDVALPFAEAGIVPQFTTSEQLGWRGLYPSSNYRLEEGLFPLEVSMTALSPIIPYDDQASALPVIFLSFYINNPSDVSYEVSALVNWENLCGCTRNSFPERRGPIRPVVVKDERPKLKQPTEEEGTEEDPRMAGLEFGFRGDIRSNAEGNYCLLAKQQQDVAVTVMGWNERDPRELDVLWGQFHYDGRLSNKISRSEESHSGAVCSTFDLPPKKGRSLVYVFAWYCPVFEAGGLDQGNGYTNKFEDSIAVATQALTYYRYYFKAVDDWHNRILSSSLPRWMSRMLINNNYVFSTNAILTKGNDFSLMESPENPMTGAMDRRFYGSIGTQLFFPRLDDGELALVSRFKDDSAPGRIYRYLGESCLHQPTHGSAPGELIDVNIKYILMVYRNYITTGRRFIVDHIFPRAHQAMEHVLSCDRDHDGLPEQKGVSSTYDGWEINGVSSYAGSLWIAALRAFSRLCRKLGHKDEAAKWDEVLLRAMKSFEEKLWYEEGGYYRLAWDAAAPEGRPQEDNTCFSGQLAGQWYADYLCLGALFPPDHIKRALAAICRLNEKKTGLASGSTPEGESITSIASAEAAWPSFDTAQFACLLIRHGYPDRGIYSVQKAYKNIHGRRGRTFNQPMNWNLATNDACGPNADRHMASPSSWHLLFAIVVYHLNVPDGAFWLRPNLPRGVYSLSAPVFTPLSFGWVKFREDDEPVYRQVVHLSFDSPIKLKTIVLRLPDEVEDVQIRCESTDKVEDVDHVIGVDGKERLLEIITKEPIMVGNLLKITLTQTHGRKYRFPVRGDS